MDNNRFGGMQPYDLTFTFERDFLERLFDLAELFDFFNLFGNLLGNLFGISFNVI